MCHVVTFSSFDKIIVYKFKIVCSFRYIAQNLILLIPSPGVITSDKTFIVKIK